MEAKLTREQANDLLHKYVKGEHYIVHCYAVEAIMRGLAKRLAPDDVEYWGICGLLHDLDEEKCPCQDPERRRFWRSGNGKCDHGTQSCLWQEP